ncbi:MAG: Transcriptional regulator MraZ [Verrucomicrobiae bacterium]|nr:Transcriptional regulator MraZ [Verrucomicrobiae bacterium]
MEKVQKRTVFVGTFRHSVDEKKRLAIPAKWRGPASDAQEFFVMPLPNNHLFVLPESAMATLLDRVDAISVGEYEQRNALRLIAGDAHQAQCDGQGRIILTEELMRHAGIQAEAVLVGTFRGFEIWSPERHAEVKQNTAGKFEESVKQLGL